MAPPPDILDEFPDELRDEDSAAFQDEGDGDSSSSSLSETKSSSSSQTKTSSSSSLSETKTSSSSSSSWSSLSVSQTKTSSSISETKTSSSSLEESASSSSSSSVDSKSSSSSSSSNSSVSIFSSHSISGSKSSSSSSISGSKTSNSQSVTSWSGSLSQSVAFGADGLTYGEYKAEGDVVFSWEDWKYKESGGGAVFTDIWGRIELQEGQEFVSPVIDLGDTSSKLLSIKFNHYISGYGKVVLEWRGQATVFNQWDNESVGPSWNVYLGGNESWRYIQLKIGPA